MRKSWKERKGEEGWVWLISYMGLEKKERKKKRLIDGKKEKID